MRTKLVRFQPEILLDLLRGSITQCIANQLTPSSKIVDKGYDLTSGDFYITVEDPEFDELEEGQLIPQLRPVLHRITHV